LASCTLDTHTQLHTHTHTHTNTHTHTHTHAHTHTHTRYNTALIGKWHCGHAAWEQTPTRRGFDTFYGYMCNGAIDFNEKTNMLYVVPSSMKHIAYV
jgi:arylsulfatase A-like enzyme